MKYIVIKLTNGEWVKVASKDIVALCLASTNEADELFIERQLYSGTEDNTVLSGADRYCDSLEQQMWHNIQENDR